MVFLEEFFEKVDFENNQQNLANIKKLTLTVPDCVQGLSVMHSRTATNQYALSMSSKFGGIKRALIITFISYLSY